ncbi:hypothetical protein [Spongiactinospora sp. TRM90649]|uniref:hypothetical protein n=1 Tax=Spongiactinospora sp. TRM90649 TaxID=3031114 RepID=UPI0023F90778|nr:hypothetical protein [Spongiactinospora sp. TRM90649]MDF5759308.1 hypothetical protein [Spongiactinospora sp. TRM90649]
MTDTGGPGRPVVYLNSRFATQTYWRRVVAELGRDPGYRQTTYDIRARGRSRRAADCPSRCTERAGIRSAWRGRPLRLCDEERMRAAGIDMA